MTAPKPARKMKPVMAWTAIMDSGKVEPQDDNPRLPYLASSRKQARRLLPGGWRIARVRIIEVTK